MEKKIAIVEDEAILSLKIKSDLEEEGYKVTDIYVSGEEALNGITLDMPDLILMDITIKGEMDGIETARLITRDYSIPIIYLTAHSDKNLIEKAKLTRPYGYIIKPYTMRELSTDIEIALYKHELDTEKALLIKELAIKNKELKNYAMQEHNMNVEKERLLIQQSKLASMGEMLGVIAHQWKQPLNALGIIVQGLDAITNIDNANKEIINNSIKNCMNQIDFMSKTIDNFRNFMRTSRERQVVYIGRLIQDVIFMLSGEFRNNNIKVSINCDDAMQMECYPNDLKHIILNILSNAKDAIVSARLCGIVDNRSEGHISIDVKQTEDNNKARISIKDDGGGIKGEIIDKVFDPYFTTKKEGEGTGMGLYMARFLVNNMGGNLTVKDVPSGAEFVIEI